MPPSEYGLNADLLSKVKDAVSEVFDSESVIMGKEGEPLVRILGSFTVPPDRAYQELIPRLTQLHLTALFRRDAGKQSISILPGITPISLGSNKLNVILLTLTLFSTLFVGTMMVSPDIGDFIRRPWLGLPFALSLMVILGAHELGHYFAARQYDVPVTLPYFIPMPLGPFGTLGAFISMKAPPPNRRALLTIATAGPLSGFVLAVPILLLGLSMSPITPLASGEGVVMEGNSILYALFKIVTFGRFLPSGGEDVLLHPVAFAGWAGLLVTALNLIPVGQLDGGHILFALSPRLHELLRKIRIPILLLMGLTFWTGWYVWALILFFIGSPHPYPDYMDYKLGTSRKIIAFIAIIIFFLCIIPTPIKVQ